MEVLLSGSVGLKTINDKYYDNVLGALVYVKSKRTLGYIMSAIDLGLKLDLCRLKVWLPNEKFGTFLDDMTVIQALTGSSR